MAKKIPMTNERRERLLNWMMSKFEAKEDWLPVREPAIKLHSLVFTAMSKYRTASEQKTLDKFSASQEVSFSWHDKFYVETDDENSPRIDVYFDTTEPVGRGAAQIFAQFPTIRRPNKHTLGAIQLPKEAFRLRVEILTKIEELLQDRRDKRKEINSMLLGFRTIEEFEAKVMPLPEEIRKQVRPFVGTVAVVNDEQCTKLREDLSSVLAA